MSDAEPNDNEVAPPNPELALSYRNYVDYISLKVPFVTVSGGIMGASVGYYIGNFTALYGYSIAFGLCASSSIYFTTNFAVRHFRDADDYISHSISGSVTGGLAAALTKGPTRAPVGLIVGAVTGCVYKFLGDMIYDELREVWIRRRVRALHSPHRVLWVRKRKYIPKPGEEKLEDLPMRVDESRPQGLAEIRVMKDGLEPDGHPFHGSSPNGNEERNNSWWQRIWKSSQEK
jgi:uncharacterized membrane protein YeaQ/YmgE (transglycosylase-associated protein family)